MTPNSVEANIPDLKPGNEARSWWFNHQKRRTRVALLFLHGFSASPGEAADVPVQMAASLSANLYAHRWPGHGLCSAEAMQGLTLGDLYNSSIAALSQARRLGDAVVIVGSSLGASLGLWLASVRPDDVRAVVAWSPGIRPFNSDLLDQLCDAAGPVVDPTPRSPEVRANWSETVHPDGYRALRSLFRSFADDPPWPRVTCPVFLGYYRSPQGEEDQVASVPAMLEMFEALGTPAGRKLAVAFDTGAHGIGSPYKSALAGEVARASVEFLVSQAGATA
jgi:pimeloyl-ACP methyl ester carboxylesterase